MESGRDYNYWKLVANRSQDFIDFLFSKYLKEYEQSELLAEFYNEEEDEGKNLDTKGK